MRDQGPGIQGRQEEALREATFTWGAPTAEDCYGKESQFFSGMVPADSLCSRE